LRFEVQVARSLDIQLSVLLHRPASHLDQNRKPFARKKTSLSVAIGDYGAPLLHVGRAFISARWLLSKLPKLEATKWHSVGHL
jgi:hypothetical protein